MRYWVVGIFIFLLDQLTKYFVSKSYSLGQSVEIVSGILWFTRMHNYGAAFGLLSGRVYFLAGMSFLVIVVAIASRNWIRALGDMAYWGFLAVLAGALGNLTDRIIRGYVVDFIDVKFWPVFNVADLAITIGVVIVGWQFLNSTPCRGDDCRG